MSARSAEAAFYVGLFQTLEMAREHVCDCAIVKWRWDPRWAEKKYKLQGDPGCQACRGAGAVDKCTDCAGAGMRPGSQICAACRGTGKVPMRKKAA